MRVDIVEIDKRVWQLGEHDDSCATIHLAGVLASEGIHKVSVMLFEYGLQTGVWDRRNAKLTRHGVRLVSTIGAAIVAKELQSN